MNRRITCLYLPNWPIQRVLAGRKQNDKGRRTKDENGKNKYEVKSFVLSPSYFVLILHARDARRGDLVVACNAVAEACGVRLGMPLAEAEAMAEHGGRNRPVLVLSHEPVEDLAELARLAERCERFSPIVGWETAESFKFQVPGFKSGAYPTWNVKLGTWNCLGPDCLFLDVTGIGVLFGGEEKLTEAVVKDCGEIGYEARVAVADTIGAAWAAATQESSRFKVQGSRFESTWNLNCLRLEPATVDLLSQLGIATLEGLLALPRETLRARFGERLLLRVDQLLGTAQEIIVPHRPAPQFVEEWVLEYPAERREMIEQVVWELVRRIATALANRREGMLKLNCRLDCAPGRPVVLEIGLFRPSADEKHLSSLVAMQLEQARLPGPVGRVRLEAALTGQLENRQGELFAGNQHESERQFALFIDRCSSRLGASAVLRPELTADPLPERAVKYRSTKYEVRSTKKGRRTKDEGRTNHLPVSSFGLRPLSLFSPPPVLEVMSVAPDGPPVWFGLAGEKYEVVVRAGPERIETGWWRGKTVRRDYWRVVTASGQRFWVFRDLGDQNWYLHGEFS